MTYFKTIKLPINENEVMVEDAIRKFSLKRHGSLDLKQSSSYISEDNKYFLGQETDRYIKITRLRTPFENLFPKIILRFDKSNFNSFKIRYSFPSNLVFAVLTIAVFVNFTNFISSGRLGSNIEFVIFSAVVFTFLTLIEIKITTRKIEKSIIQTKTLMSNSNKSDSNLS